MAGILYSFNYMVDPSLPYSSEVQLFNIIVNSATIVELIFKLLLTKWSFIIAKRKTVFIVGSILVAVHHLVSALGYLFGTFTPAKVSIFLLFVAYGCA
jgi:hypothetical protein